LQAERACIINLVEHDVAIPGGRRADPEAQAGRALRRLRLARNWSQDEVAVRMTAYGYDFHQTTIAKIEAAQRPLRVRELADFAALYGVEVQDLVYPPSRSLPEIDQEIADVRARLEIAQAEAGAAAHQLDRARRAEHNAEAAYRVLGAEVTVLEGRLASLSADREKAIGWESDGESSLADDSDTAERNAAGATATSITSVAGGGPTVLRIVLGTNLRRLRERAGITAEDAASAIRGSHSKISRLETGRMVFKERDLVDLLHLYGVRDRTEYQSLLELARQANTPGWWQDYSDILPNWFQNYIAIEMAAAEIWAYETRSVPELLQTDDYSRALASRGYGDDSAGEIERRVRQRATRQENFLDQSNPPALRVLLDEAVLRRQVDGETVMRGQLRHLAEIAERPNTTVQVLPFDTGNGPAQGSFSILRFTEPDMPDFVYVEQLTSVLYLDRPEDVENYRRVMERLSSRALTPQQTTLFLRKLLSQAPHQD
jgi:transcriptional regulator with XRE-family HTH domain